MREIKFRGKSIESGEWVYGDISVICADDGEITINYPHKHSTSGLHMTMSIPVNPDTVGQFIGLHGKSGEDIYEGDIVRSASTRLFEVRYELGAYRGKHGDSKIVLEDDSYYEVIGNIFDTPELLQQC